MADGRTVLVALGMLRSHYPGEHPAIEEATVYAWSASGLGGLPDEALLIAAEEWDTTAHRRFPSSGEFQVEAAAVARRLAEEARDLADAEQARALPPPPADVQHENVAGFVLPVSTPIDAAYVEAIRAGLAARKEVPPRRYVDGVNEVLQRHGLPLLDMGDDDDAIGTERPLSWHGTGPDHAVRCLVCGDSGWLTTGNNVRPCNQCRPIAYRRWHEGHFAPGHDCDECRLFRRHKPPVWAQELQAAGFDRRPAA